MVGCEFGGVGSGWSDLGWRALRPAAVVDVVM